MKWKALLFRLALLAIATVVSACLAAGSLGSGRVTANDGDLQDSDQVTLTVNLQPAEMYDLDFSTYFGGSDFEHARDVFVDSQGNVYITGGTASADFPTTAGAYDRSHNGSFDIFVTKFDPNGQLVWSTLVGGWDYDRAYAIEVDSESYVYVGGRGGRGAPITSGVVQETFKGQWHGNPFQSDMNAYLFKLSPDGSNLEWATYFGTGEKFRDIDIDQDGNVYGVWHDPLNSANPYRDSWRDPAWFVNVFQPNPQGGNGDFGVVKISSDGTRVLWATYLAGSGEETGAGSVRVDPNGYVYAETWTRSFDMPTTPGAYDRTHNGAADFYVAKLTPDGSGLVFGTYLGGSGSEIHSTHNLALDHLGNAYVSVWTDSADFPTTRGAFQRTYGGDYSDMAVAKFSPTGSLIASTFIGGSDGENADGIYVDAAENVYLSGYSRSPNFPVTSGAYQSNFNGVKDTVFVKLSADFSQLLYSTYIGGSSGDDARSSFLASDGKWFTTGSSGSSDWPTKNAHQNSSAGGGDVILAKFTPSSRPVPPAAVIISGPTTGLVQVGYSFTATVSPVTATPPITYVWQATNQAPVIHTVGLSDTVAFAWDVAGNQSLTVTAANAGGQATNAHAISISSTAGPVAPTAASIGGPMAGLVQVDHAFTATVSPVTATLPITYAWQATHQASVTHRGGLSDTVAFAWDVTGTQAITVTAANAGGMVTDTYSITIAPAKRVFLPLIMRSWLGGLLERVQSLIRRR